MVTMGTALMSGQGTRTHDSHPVLLRGLDTGERPLILESTEADFITAAMDTLKRGLSAALGSKAHDVATAAEYDPRPLQGRFASAPMKLYQPIQRTFHLVLFEAVCDDGFMYPRLDPKKVLSAGLVVRRLSTQGLLAWGSFSSAGQGWIARSTPQLELDPEPTEAPDTLHTGSDELDRQIALLSPVRPLFKETTTSLFPVPADVMEATGRTILYGLVPTSSSEMEERASALSDPASVAALLPTYLRANSATRPVGRADDLVSFASIADATANDIYTNNRLFLDFVTMVRQLTLEFGAFAAPGDITPQGQAMFNALNAIRLPYHTQAERRPYEVPAGDALKVASEVLITRTRASNVQMPSAWPAVTQAQADAIATAAAQIVTAQVANVRPQRGRFSNPRWTYQLRAYARVQHDSDCPPDTVWSNYSAPFIIAPWYEGKGPVMPIVLPDTSNLKKLKPNVAFQVPRDLMGLLEGSDPKDLMEGKGKSINLTFDWICSFNIPVITICAFIVLNIFLSLFNLIFQWMMFIKICIPIPREE